MVVCSKALAHQAGLLNLQMQVYSRKLGIIKWAGGDTDLVWDRPGSEDDWQ